MLLLEGPAAEDLVSALLLVGLVLHLRLCRKHSISSFEGMLLLFPQLAVHCPKRRLGTARWIYAFVEAWQALALARCR